MIHDMGAKYHHGDLRSELVRVSFELIAEQGIAGFSVAQVAKRANVSAAAPYRHFPDRSSLLAAVAAEAACRLRGFVEAAATGETDPVARLATAIGAYTRFQIDTQVGFPVIFAAGLDDPKFTELHEQRRATNDAYLMLCLEVTPTPAAALELLEQLYAQAHGYGDMYREGTFARLGYPPETVVEKATNAARLVIEAHQAAAQR
ncbi:TetR/AcrR family transcriptional regulator [Amycolatopsis rhabdoformis]|uniref:TetR/AcrR family transcriptional regulator n=1 Tax=Amycolatopsis rhabdoformis TaxID=1448059 RepID=A0ABZ1I5J8_9PSEU|nr:TetR/AcrR family transcriptional regulator [Amycolatopsis rhabdoformis]WSE28915.1 TetR/AcrR family transcriptional regulator [Amycolatopsis rhabdoformis]